MKKIIVALVFLVSTLAFAHDEGHGPKLSESGKFGGVLASVIDESEIKLGNSAKRLYKAELVRSESNELMIYLYDEKMNLHPLKSFEPEGLAKVEFKKNKKYIKTAFKLKLKGNHFEGIAPKPERKPFNIDVHLVEGAKKLFVAFDNLD